MQSETPTSKTDLLFFLTNKRLSAGTIWMLLKRGTGSGERGAGSGERGTGNGSKITSSQRYPP